MYIKVTIEGIAPILFSRFYEDDPSGKATSGEGSSIRPQDMTPMEQADLKLHKDAEGTPVVPGEMIFSCIVGAGKFFKIGKSKVTTIKTSLIPACMSIEEFQIPIQHKEPWVVDSRPVRNPATGGRFICHRPCFNDWKITFTMDLDTTMMSVKLLRDIVDKAGKCMGLGNYRPACKGPFGKFVVTNWETEK